MAKALCWQPAEIAVSPPDEFIDSRCRQKFLLDDPVKILDHVPRFLWRFGVLKQIQVFIADHAFVREKLEIDNFVPVLSAVKNDGNLLHPPRLSKCQRGK